MMEFTPTEVILKRAKAAAACPALLIETDGYTYHSSRPDWQSDHLRDQAALARGLTRRIRGSCEKDRAGHRY